MKKVMTAQTCVQISVVSGSETQYLKQIIRELTLQKYNTNDYFSTNNDF